MMDYTITLALYLMMAVGVLTGYLIAPKPHKPITRKDWLPDDTGDGYAPIKSEGIMEHLINTLRPPENKPYVNPKKPQPWLGLGENNE